MCCRTCWLAASVPVNLMQKLTASCRTQLSVLLALEIITQRCLLSQLFSFGFCLEFANRSSPLGLPSLGKLIYQYIVWPQIFYKTFIHKSFIEHSLIKMLRMVKIVFFFCKTKAFLSRWCEKYSKQKLIKHNGKM